MLYLSNFQTAAKYPNAISIAAMTPRWYKGAVRKDLAPKMSTVTKLHKNLITPMEYVSEYFKIIYSHDLDKLAEELDGHVLLCYCDKEDLCHRTILGAYLKLETGIEVEEINGFGENFINDFKTGEVPMDVILDENEIEKYGLRNKYEDDNIVGHWHEINAIGANELFLNW